MTRAPKAFTVTNPNYLPGGFPVPPEAAMEAGASDDVRQCRVVISALDAVQAGNMLVQRGLHPSTSVVTEAKSFEVAAMREAGLFARPMVWLLVWATADLVVVQVTEDGNMQRAGRISGAGGRARFEADETPAAPAGIDPKVVRYLTEMRGRSVDRALRGTLYDLQVTVERDRLPTSGEMEGLATSLIQVAGDLRAMEALAQLLPKEQR